MTDQRTASDEFAAGAGDLAPCTPNRILLVDDDKAILRLFNMILSTDLPGCSIDFASDGKQAVDAFRNGHHAVLVLDLKMPVMEGVQAFHKIQEHCKAQHWAMPAVVICTGFLPPALATQIVTRDPRHCLLKKPVTPKELVEAVQSRLAPR